jgi:hypothetical protein
MAVQGPTGNSSPPREINHVDTASGEQFNADKPSASRQNSQPPTAGLSKKAAKSFIQNFRPTEDTEGKNVVSRGVKSAVADLRDHYTQQRQERSKTALGRLRNTFSKSPEEKAQRALVKHTPQNAEAARIVRASGLEVLAEKTARPAVVNKTAHNLPTQQSTKPDASSSAPKVVLPTQMWKANGGPEVPEGEPFAF